MKILGIRVSPQATRFALVEFESSAYKLLNSNTESRLIYPAGLPTSAEKVEWLYLELERLLNEHPDIARVCIKTNEYTPTDSKPKRLSAHLEGAILLFCRQNQILVSIKTYLSLGTRSSEVKNHAEQRVGRTRKYWDTKMADAVVAAWQGIPE